MKESARQSVCRIIAGPNGAGKTTFALEYLPDVAAGSAFINADLIAAGLGNEFMEAGIGLGIRFSGPDARLHVRSLFLDGLFLPVACVGRGQHCGVWLEQQAHIKHIQCQPVIVIDEFEA